MKSTPPKNLLKPKNILIITASILILINLGASLIDALDLYSQRKTIPFFFLGDRFSGIEKTFQGIKYVGFITDKSMDVNSYAAQFAQAQYTLAPVILELNNPNHEFLLFDCTNESIAFEKLKELKAIPIKRNRFGIIFAKKTSPNSPLPSISTGLKQINFPKHKSTGFQEMEQNKDETP